MMTNNLKHTAEYFALKATAGLVTRLPYRLALTVGWNNALISYSLMRKRRRAAKQRIRSVFGSHFSATEVEWIAWTSWRNTIFSAVEMLRIPNTTFEWIASVSNMDSNLKVLKDHADTGTGAIIACAHMGNWELAGVACHLYGIPIFSIAARQRNSLVSDYITDLRRAPGIETVERGSGTMRAVLTRLRQGKFLAILPDVRMPTPALQIPFLGGTANIGHGMALFARHANVPIFPCFLSRDGWASHRLVIHNTVVTDRSRDKDTDIYELTHSVTKLIEDHIMRDPSQWFWFNKRWILDPMDH